jgi:hypothetical protein
MRRKVISLVLLSGALCAPQAAYASTTVLQPSSQWGVDFGATRCRLAREFGVGDEKHVISFEQWAPSSEFSFTAAGPALKAFKSRKETSVRFSAQGAERKQVPFKGDSQTLGAAIVFSSLSHGALATASGGKPTAMSLPQLDLASAGQAEFIELRQSGRTIRFKTGSLKDAFAVMNTCTQDLVKSWGFDLQAHLTASRMADLENAAAIAKEVQSLYPRKALARGEQAILQARVKVDAGGNPSQCVIESVTRTQELDSPACAPLLGAAFAPALDAAGKPFDSYWVGTLVYRIN